MKPAQNALANLAQQRSLENPRNESDPADSNQLRQVRSSGNI